MTSDDNVIPFPGRPDHGLTQETARELVDQLMSQGHTPQDILTSVLGGLRGLPGLELPGEREPELRAPREEPATYVVRVDLDHAKPPIWRRLHLASDLTLDRVHRVLQGAMGWEGYHLHQFVAGPGARDRMVAAFLTDFDISEGDEGIAEADVRLDQVLASPGDRLHYTYDFGDGWDHTLRLEAIEPRGDGPVARCVGGRRACPPEDVGGLGGYHEVVELLSSPRPDDLPDHLVEKLDDWMPPGFDPAAFDVEEADDAIADALLTEAELRAHLATHPALAELVARLELPALRAVRGLLAAAGHGAADDVDRAAAMGPLLALMERAAGEGIELTSAGRLRPAVVKELLTTLGWDAPWLGKGNREDSCPPIRHLRAAAQGTGLVRRHRGRLVLTPAGRRVAGEPQAVWDHVASRLPLGRHEWERQAGAVVLLCLASGGRESFDYWAPPLLADSGWTIGGGPPTDFQAFEFARPTWEVFWILSDLAHAPGRPLPPSVPALAREALVTSDSAAD